MKSIAQKTNTNLLARLKAAAKSPLTHGEIEKQRISFVYSIVGDRDGMTREKLENLLKHQASA